MRGRILAPLAALAVLASPLMSQKPATRPAPAAPAVGIDIPVARKAVVTIQALDASKTIASQFHRRNAARQEFAAQLLYRRAQVDSPIRQVRGAALLPPVSAPTVMPPLAAAAVVTTRVGTSVLKAMCVKPRP